MPRAVGAVVAHFPDTEGVTGSSPVPPTGDRMNPCGSRARANVPIREPTVSKPENSLGIPPFWDGLAGTCIAHSRRRLRITEEITGDWRSG